MVVKVFLDVRRRMVVHGKPFVIVLSSFSIHGPSHIRPSVVSSA